MGGGEWVKVAAEGVRDLGAPCWPRVQFNSTFAVLPLVVKFSVASPPNNQNCMNSLTDASRNLKFNLQNLIKLTLSETIYLVSRNFFAIFICKRYICEVDGLFRTSWNYKFPAMRSWNLF